MTISVGKLGDLYESVGPEKFEGHLNDLLGMSTDKHGRPCVDLDKQVIKPGSLSFQDLAQRMLGYTTYDKMINQPYGMRGGRAKLFAEVGEDAFGGVMTAGHFNQINGLLGTVGGLAIAALLEGYQVAETIGDDLVTLLPNQKTQEHKRIRYSPPTNKAGDLEDSEQIPMGNLAQEWILDSKMSKQGQGLAITRETFHFDQTGTVISAMTDIGYQLKENKEEKILKPVFGIENTYNYNGTGTDTYLTAGAYINKLTNELTFNETCIDAAEQLLTNMTNPQTGRPINLSGVRNLVTTNYKRMTAARLARVTGYELGARDATGVAATAPYYDNLKPAWSVRARNLMKQSFPAKGRSGAWVALTDAQAKERWVYGDTKKAFAYREAWPLTTYKFGITDDPSLARQEVYLAIFATEFGSVTTTEPRAVVLCIKDS